MTTDDEWATEDVVVKSINSSCCVKTEVKALLLVESSTSFNDVVITILEKVVAGVFANDNVLCVMMVSSARLLATTAIKTKKR